MEKLNIFELTGIFLVPFLTVLVSVYIGQKFGSYRIRKKPDIPHAPVGSLVAALLGLLAFILAFAFQIAVNHFDTRKSLLLEEVTTIRNTYLQAGLIEEPIRSDTRKLLVEYVDLRVDLIKDFSRLTSTLSRSQQILDTLWRYTEILAEKDRSSEVYSLFTSTINELVDNYNQRIIMLVEIRIPSSVMWVLLLITFCSMLTLGYQFGISGKGSNTMMLLVAITFAAVIFLITALDRPETGLAQINQNPMYSLQDQLHARQGK